MGRRNREGVRYPDDLMSDLPWSFAGPTFSSQEAFVEAVRQYELEFTGEATWRPEEVVLRSRRVRVQHEYGDDPDEASAVFTADRPAGFTAAELLFKVHNAFAEQLSEGDHHFFEGFSLVGDGGADPLYEIELGS